MKKFFLFFTVCIIASAVAECAFAADAATGAIFDALATKAGNIGSGLQQAGYIIAGFGLIVFSFMAIFNKISWKNLAYIMLSCFVLSFMVALVQYIGKGSKGGTPDVKFSGVQLNASAASGTGTGSTIDRSTNQP